MFKDIILSSRELPPTLWYKYFVFHLKAFNIDDIETLREKVHPQWPYPVNLKEYKNCGGTLGGIIEALTKFCDEVEKEPAAEISKFINVIENLRTELYEKLLESIYCPSYLHYIQNIEEFSRMSTEKGLKIKHNQMASFADLKSYFLTGDMLWIFHQPKYMNSYAHVVIICDNNKYIHINAPNAVIGVQAKAIVKEDDQMKLSNEKYCFVVRQSSPENIQTDIFSERAKVCKGIRFNYKPDTSNCETFCNGVHGKWIGIQVIFVFDKEVYSIHNINISLESQGESPKYYQRLYQN